MPPTPPTTAHRGVRALLLVALPLLLGFATGVLIAADLRREQPRPEAVARTTAPETEAARAERERRRARARDHRARLVAPVAARPADGPTRRSVQQAVDAIDPRDWLAGYGTVIETPREPSAPPDLTAR